MVSFVGRSENHVLFSEDDRSVIVDSRASVVVASGSFSDLAFVQPWADGEYSESDIEIAASALSAMTKQLPEPTGRMYTIPRGVQTAARKGLSAIQGREHEFSPGTLRTASLLASGGQISFNQLAVIRKFFTRPEFSNLNSLTASASSPADLLTHLLHGGSTGEKWAANIVDREEAPALPPVDVVALTEKLSIPSAGPEFIGRLCMDGSGIDRLYRIDLDGRTYVWDLGAWTDFGATDWSIWDYDSFLDEAVVDDGAVQHIQIDPESAIFVAANLKFGKVLVEDIAPAEFALVEEAAGEIDFETVDDVLIAAAGDGEYTSEERSKNAESQVRDATGRFAKMGSRVVIGDNPLAAGKITRVNPANSTLEVELDNGNKVVVPAKQVKAAGDVQAATIPGRAPEVPRVDFTGILGEPRTPLNRTKGILPGTLPAMTTQDLHNIINNFPSWVQTQRQQFKAVSSPSRVGVQAKNSLNTGKEGAAFLKETGAKLTTDAYDHPLLQKYLNKKKGNTYPNRLWYNPIVASGDEDQPLTPETSDVQPIYMAVVSPDDPRAVFDLICLIPAGSHSIQPMIYSREDGKWVKDEQALNDLRSATPPPVVPLDSDTLSEVLPQVDGSQAEASAENTEEDQAALEAPLPAGDAVPQGAPEPQQVVVASAMNDLDFNLMVLWGPREDIMQAALTAAGGLDRNRGGAEKLRRYWTKGPGAAKIRWGTPGDWTRCVRNLSKYLGPRARGYCALRHKEMTGMWTGDQKHRELFSLFADNGNAVFSSDIIRPTEDIVNDAVLRASRDANRTRMEAIVASGTPSPLLTVYPTRETAITACAGHDLPAEGAQFWIPLALPEGIESGDGRTVEEGAADIRILPIPLLWQFQTAPGHEGAVVVGRIDHLSRVPGGIGAGLGRFDTGPWGREAERMVRNGMLRFVSADMDKFSATEDTSDSAASDEKVIENKKTSIKKARVMAVTIVAKPAFQEATIQLVPDTPIVEDDMFLDGLFTDEPDPADVPALIAAGYIADAIPVTPPSDWFENPNLDGPTPLTVTDDGRVFGHIAAWTSNHIGAQFGGVNPPKSHSNYAYFHSGVVRTEEGKDVPVGQITLTGGHAGLAASAREAIKHYDDTGSAIADVHAGEDAYGIWVAGSLRPGTTPEQIRAFRASAPSGDWRPIRGKLELVAVCQVNVPGFPIARTLVASGHVQSIVAAGAAPLAKMMHDPISEMSARLEEVEKFATAELEARRQAALDRISNFTSSDTSQEELQARFEALRATVASFATVEAPARVKPVFASAADMRAHIASLAEFAKRKKTEEEIAQEIVQEEIHDDQEKDRKAREEGKYTPQTQPRDYKGRFRDVLARLKSDLGTSGNQGVVDKIKETDARVQTGDYITAARSAVDLKGMIDRLGDGALTDNIGSIRETARALGEVIANMPLPFHNQAEKVRFSDLPPALRDLMSDFVDRVESKLSDDEEAKAATADVRSFMSGGDLYSQSDVSQKMSKLLRLLT